jgi:flagellar hook-basal body complex protein FliE
VTAISSSSLLAMRASVLQKNDALQRAAGPSGIAGIDDLKPGSPGFADMLKGALAQANELQAKSAAVTEAYEKGEVTDIAAVMLTRQTASVSFEATLQVRNKLLSAYKDIMSMPV